MKRVLIATTLMTVMAGSAFAMTYGQDGLPDYARIEAQSLVPGARFDDLSSAQVGAILTALYGDTSGRGAAIRSILMWD